MSAAPEFLTVAELADLLRIKERKVYDLAAAGDVPCNRSTGKLLFPASEVRAWISEKQTGPRTARPAVFLGSHEPLLEWALRQSQCGLATYFDGSSDGLERFAAGEGVATGLHIPDAEGWNLATVGEQFAHADAVLLSWASRQRGLVFRADDPHAPSGIADLSGRRFAARQPASGSSLLLERLLAEAGVEDVQMTAPFHSEQDAVLAVIEGAAEVALGLEAMARQFGLAFVPLVREEFDILIDRRAFFEKPFQSFLAFCQTDVFRTKARNQPGYSVEALGQVRWNA